MADDDGDDAICLLANAAYYAYLTLMRTVIYESKASHIFSF